VCQKSREWNVSIREKSFRPTVCSAQLKRAPYIYIYIYIYVRYTHAKLFTDERSEIQMFDITDTAVRGKARAVFGAGMFASRLLQQ